MKTTQLKQGQVLSRARVVWCLFGYPGGTRFYLKRRLGALIALVAVLSIFSVFSGVGSADDDAQTKRFTDCVHSTCPGDPEQLARRDPAGFGQCYDNCFALSQGRSVEWVKCRQRCNPGLTGLLPQTPERATCMAACERLP